MIKRKCIPHSLLKISVCKFMRIVIYFNELLQTKVKTKEYDRNKYLRNPSMITKSTNCIYYWHR